MISGCKYGHLCMLLTEPVHSVNRTFKNRQKGIDDPILKKFQSRASLVVQPPWGDKDVVIKMLTVNHCELLACC